MDLFDISKLLDSVQDKNTFPGGKFDSSVLAKVVKYDPADVPEPL